jgi:hypothetical protein
MARHIVTMLAAIVIGGVLGASVYNSVVDARSWGSNIPESLTTAQQYFAVVHGRPARRRGSGTRMAGVDHDESRAKRGAANRTRR